MMKERVECKKYEEAMTPPRFFRVIDEYPSVDTKAQLGKSRIWAEEEEDAARI